jgi:hypothetical protein
MVLEDLTETHWRRIEISATCAVFKVLKFLHCTFIFCGRSVSKLFVVRLLEEDNPNPTFDYLTAISPALSEESYNCYLLYPLCTFQNGRLFSRHF